MVAKYPRHYYIIGALIIIIGICAGYIFYQPTGTDYRRAVDAVERAQEQQRESLDLNQTIKASVDRSASLNREASERIERIEVYQHQAITRIDESTKRLDEAERLLERNEQLVRDVEQGHQAQQGDRTTATPTTQQVGNR